MVVEQLHRLRDLSGLGWSQLAWVLGVTRASLHRWRNGVKPTVQHREHLLRMLPIIETVAERLGCGATVAMWLETPWGDGGVRPLDWLRDREYETFRGAMLHIRPPDWKRVDLPREVFEERLERLQPRAFVGDFEEGG